MKKAGCCLLLLGWLSCSATAQIGVMEGILQEEITSLLIDAHRRGIRSVEIDMVMLQGNPEQPDDFWENGFIEKMTFRFIGDSLLRQNSYGSDHYYYWMDGKYPVPFDWRTKRLEYTDTYNWRDSAGYGILQVCYRGNPGFCTFTTYDRQGHERGYYEQRDSLRSRGVFAAARDTEKLVYTTERFRNNQWEPTAYAETVKYSEGNNGYRIIRSGIYLNHGASGDALVRTEYARQFYQYDDAGRIRRIEQREYDGQGDTWYMRNTITVKYSYK